MSDSLQPHGLQHARLLCPPLLPRVCSNLCPLSWWCYLTTSSSAPSSPFAFNLSSIRVFSNELALHIRWLKYWSFRISPSNEYLGLIFFRIDWFDLLAVHGPLEKGMANHFSIRASRTPWTVWIGLKMEGSISWWVKTWPLESCSDSTPF